MMPRPDGRRNDQMREVRMTPHFQQGPAGSVLIECGQTRVACAVSVDLKVPPWMAGRGRGWLTAEYGMLPGSSPQRIARPQGKPDGRATEIQRLIGRSLRAMVDLQRLGEITLQVDCDVIDADGGTRTAAITGAAVAVVLALAQTQARGALPAGVPLPVHGLVAATSVGLVEGEVRLDLPYAEDHRAEVDCNLVMTSAGALIEVQATAEHGTFGRDTLATFLELGEAGIAQLFAQQRALLAAEGVMLPSGA
ncbi:MAG TPA: ribonuclease PH [Chloroflexia bacterium]|nr:ribonuclease PH [Chloroflexia bacterium]